MAQTAFAPKSQNQCNISVNDDEFGVCTSSLFGVFVGQFCDMIVKKSAILSLLI
jgi:hypothetical protein